MAEVLELKAPLERGWDVFRGSVVRGMRAEGNSQDCIDHVIERVQVAYFHIFPRTWSPDISVTVVVASADEVPTAFQSALEEAVRQAGKTFVGLFNEATLALLFRIADLERDLWRLQNERAAPPPRAA